MHAFRLYVRILYDVFDLCKTLMNNEEIDNILRKEDIVRFVKARRIRWIGHVERMKESRMPQRVMREKIYTRTRRGRPKIRWFDDVQEDYERWGLKDGEGKPRVENCGGE